MQIWPLFFSLVCFGDISGALAADSINGHNCHISDVILDTVWIVDSSASVGTHGFAGEKAALSGIFHLLTIDQDHTRVGLVNMAETASQVGNLQDYESNEAAIDATLAVPFDSRVGLDIDGALKIGEKIFSETDNRPDVPNVMVLFSSTSVDCIHRYPSKHYPACITVSKFTDITLVTVALKFHEDPTQVPFNMSAYSFSNDQSLVDGLIDLFCTLSPPLTNPPTSCPCVLENLWLDVVVIFDSSNGAGRYNFAAQRAAVIGLLHRINVNQQEGMFTRLALVNLGRTAIRVSNLTTYEYIADAIQEIAEMEFIGDDDLNLLQGLTEAERIFQQSDARTNARNVIVDFTNKLTYCSNPLSGDQEENPCSMAVNLRKNGIVIMTIDVFLRHLQSMQLSDFGNACFRMSNTPQLMANLEQNLCKANCFCEPPMMQFAVEDQCEFYGECVSMGETPTGSKSADLGCRLMGTTVADVRSPDKDHFLFGIANDWKSFPYLLGLEYKQGAFTWGNGDKMESTDLIYFAHGEPNLANGNCTAVRIRDDGSSGGEWVSVPCGYATPSFYYFCQKQTCDTTNYCAATTNDQS